MKALSLDEARSVQLNVLKDFRTFCEQHGLRYSLYAGTLIGALRHKGYIPWDDDIDVAMPRDDYERLYALFSKNYHPEHLKLYDSREVPHYHFPFMKLADTRTLQKGPGKEEPRVQLGLHIDVFALDGLPRYRWMAVLYLCFMRFLRHCCEMSVLTLGVKGRSFGKHCLVFLFKLMTFGTPPRFWHRLINRIAAHFPLQGSRWGGNVVWGYAVRELVPVECYGGAQTVSFEGETFRSFGESDSYLRCVYGDYMTPPEQSVRVGNHLVSCFRITD